MIVGTSSGNPGTAPWAARPEWGLADLGWPGVQANAQLARFPGAHVSPGCPSMAVAVAVAEWGQSGELRSSSPGRCSADVGQDGRPGSRHQPGVRGHPGSPATSTLPVACSRDGQGATEPDPREQCLCPTSRLRDLAAASANPGTPRGDRVLENRGSRGVGRLTLPLHLWRATGHAGAQHGARATPFSPEKGLYLHNQVPLTFDLCVFEWAFWEQGGGNFQSRAGLF